MENQRNDITAHMSGLRRYAMALVRNPVDADELVQETLCRAIEKMTPWRRIKNTRAYLYAILHNLYVDKFVKSGVRNEMISEEIVERNLVVAPSQFYRLELRELDKALEELPEQFRDVILLVGLEGMTYRAAASVLDIPVGTVMSRLSRAREMLRRETDRPKEESHDHETGITNGNKRETKEELAFQPAAASR